MEILNKGEYTGEVVMEKHFDDAIVTSTLYSEKKSNPRWHYHKNLHICFALHSGMAETRQEKSYTQQGGSIFFYHAEQEHRWISTAPIARSANIELGNSFLQENRLSSDQINRSINSRINAKTMFLKIQKELMEDGSDSHLSIETLLLELLSQPSNQSEKLYPRWSVMLKEILHDQWDEDLSLAYLSKTTGVHRVTISKYFPKYFGCTMGTYRRKLRIEKSIGLIKKSQFTLSQIAFQCGFSDQSHFTRNFKKHTGFLPKDFRIF